MKAPAWTKWPASKSPLLRFHNSYNVDSNECWIWKHAIDHKGYGVFRVGKKNLRAHRFAYAALISEIPDGWNVCHHCDVRSCVNPGHLWVGTHMENVSDMMRKGRSPNGENHGRARLSRAQALEVKLSTGPRAEIARKYGISTEYVTNIRSGKRWKILGTETPDLVGPHCQVSP